MEHGTSDMDPGASPVAEEPTTEFGVGPPLLQLSGAVAEPPLVQVGARGMARVQTTPFIFRTPHRLQARSRTPPLPEPPLHAPPAGLRQRRALGVFSENRSARDGLNAQLEEERATVARLRAQLWASEEANSELGRLLDNVSEVSAADRHSYLTGPAAAYLQKELAAARGAAVDLTRELRVAQENLALAVGTRAPAPAPRTRSFFPKAIMWGS